METPCEHLVKEEEEKEEEEEADVNDIFSDCITVNSVEEEDQCYVILDKHKYLIFGLLTFLFGSSLILTVLFAVLHHHHYQT